MKKEWEVKKLGDIISLEYGKPLDKSKRKFDGLYPVYGANGIINRTNTFLINKKSIIVGRKGSAGEINYTEDLFWPLDVTYYIKYNENEVYLDFLFYLLKQFDLPKLAKGVKPGINRNDVYSIKTAIPTILEQEKIVSIINKSFDEINQAKANIEKNLNNAKEIFQSELNNIFTNKGEGWKEERLGNCFKLKSGDGLTSKMMKKDGIFPVYGGNGIAGTHDNYNLSGDNVIIGRVGALCGNVRFIQEKIWLTDNAFQVIDYKYEFDFPFLTYLLNYKNLRNEARQSAQPVISNSSLKDVLLQFPTKVKIQQQIVNQLDALSKETKILEQKYQQKLNYLEDLKKSILQKAFNGELKTI